MASEVSSASDLRSSKERSGKVAKWLRTSPSVEQCCSVLFPPFYHPAGVCSGTVGGRYRRGTAERPAAGADGS